jgi:energy-coupling factor transporter ATP-binding protein EcfA2
MAEHGLVIETRDLTKRYGDDILAVDGLALRVRRGEVYGFLGPNGAGKTTTLRMLLGLVRPTRGSASVLDAPPGSPAGLERIGAMIGPRWSRCATASASSAAAGSSGEGTVDELRGQAGLRIRAEPVDLAERLAASLPEGDRVLVVDGQLRVSADPGAGDQPRPRPGRRRGRRARRRACLPRGGLPRADAERRRMTGSIAAELLVQRKRTSTWVLLGVWTGLSVFFLYVLRRRTR